MLFLSLYSSSNLFLPVDFIETKVVNVHLCFHEYNVCLNNPTCEGSCLFASSKEFQFVDCTSRILLSLPILKIRNFNLNYHLMRICIYSHNCFQATDYTMN